MLTNNVNGKYRNLYQYLIDSTLTRVLLTYEQFEEKIKDKLPKSAYIYKAWWGNHKGNVQAKAWLKAGYIVENVRLGESVEFKKVNQFVSQDLKGKITEANAGEGHVMVGKQYLERKAAKLDLNGLVRSFFIYVEAENIEMYNEFSFQHELGIFLRQELEGYTIQFERNVSYFSINNQTIKKEIDIAIFNEDKSEKYAIELKHPLNGQYPEQMYSFVKDIKFMEELKENGFTKTGVVVLVSDRPFYEGKINRGIYKYFREEYRVYGEIYKPTGNMKGKESIELKGIHNFQWQSLEDNRKYFVIEI